MKKKQFQIVVAFLAATVLSACSVAPQPINYGEDQCHACKMIIADRQFAAELVTTKGKVFKFDAIECLIPELQKNGAAYYAHMMVSDFQSPGTLIDGKQAFFLISPERPSPMGGNLSAYNSTASCAQAANKHKGTQYNWEQLIEKFDGYASQ